jgi:hypothetical protein
MLSRYNHAGDKGERKYSSDSFLNSASVSGQRHDPAAIYLRGKDPLDRRLSGSQSWTQRLEEHSFASSGNLKPIVQSVIRHYTDIRV